MLFAGVQVVTGINPWLIFPMFMFGTTMPRKMASQAYFTFYAELLPHTE